MEYIVGLVVCLIVFGIRWLHNEMKIAEEEILLEEWKELQEFKRKLERRNKGE